MNVMESLRNFLPETFLLCGTFLALLVDLFTPRKKAVAALSLLTALGALALCRFPSSPLPLFNGFFLLDPVTFYFRILVLGAAAFTILISWDYRPMPKSSEGEYYCLLLFLAFALITMGASSNLLMIFLSVEFVSILSYLLTGFLKKSPRSKEAALKYFLFGGLASGIMLFGMSLLFGITGSLELAVIGEKLKALENMPVLMVSLIMILTGLGFKISMAPFHMWAPDVYDAAPTPIAGFLTVAPKALGFALIIRTVLTAFPASQEKIQAFMVITSILTMTAGNIIAISQSNIKRLLAYSSIAQAGYMLMGIAAFNPLGFSGILVYVAAYALTNLGAFAAVTAASNHLKNDEIQAYSGLSRRAPFLAASLTVFLLSLAGIPPMAGFVAKFYIFSSVMEVNQIGLAVVAVINSAIAAFYYFKIVRLMYLSHATHEEPLPQPPALVFSLLVLMLGVIILGILPDSLIQFTQTIF